MGTSISFSARQTVRRAFSAMILAALLVSMIPIPALADRAGRTESLASSPVIGAYTEDNKLTASDGAEGDYFGNAVALDGATGVVGARFNNGRSGAAYVYGRDQGGVDNWGEVKKVTASDGAANNYFGTALDISVDTLVVGSHWNPANDTGAAYVFYRDLGGADNWGEVIKLTASDGGAYNYFGAAIAINGDTAAVAAYGDGGSIGAVYIFERNLGGADNWGERVKITASDAAVGARFGISIALDGDTLAVGASGESASQGAVYVFERDLGGANVWGQRIKITSASGAAGDQFGRAVSLSGDTIAAGAPFDDDKGADSGAAFVFDRNQGGADTWGQVTKLTAADGAAWNKFGTAIATDGNDVLVGAPYDDDLGLRTGSVYIYDRDQSWSQVQKLIRADAVPKTAFGNAIAYSGGTALIGSTLDDTLAHNAGAASIFTASASVGNFVWLDLNGDGIQDGGEPGLKGIRVKIFTGAAVLVNATRTAADGSYTFTDLPHGQYYLKFTSPSFSLQDQGGDDALDSDPNPATGQTITFTLNPGQDDDTWDAGIYSPQDTVGTFDPAAGSFKLRLTNDAGAPDFDFLFAADIVNGIPITGDWDGDGVDTIGVYDPAGEFRLRNTNTAGPADITIADPKLANVAPLAGDWDGDGTDTIGIYAATNGRFYLRNSNDLGPPDYKFDFGPTGGTPLAGDWNGNGVDTIGVYTTSDGIFRLRNSNSAGPSNYQFKFGPAGSVAQAIVGDWDGDGDDNPGVYIEPTSQFRLRYANSQGAADLTFIYGIGGSGLLPIAGDWDDN